MKRIEIKLLIIGLVLVMLGACSQPETLPETGDGDQRDVIAYVKSTDEMDLKSLLEAQDLLDTYQDVLHFEIEFDLPKVDEDKLLVNEEIDLNLDSSDAEAVRKILKTRFDDFMSVRKNTESKLKEGADGVLWPSQHLYGTYSHELLDSFIVYTSEMVLPGESSYNLESYAFSNTDSKQLNHSEILALLNTDLSKVESYIQNDFDENLIQFYGAETKRNLVDSMSVDKIEENNIYFRIKPENGLALTDTDLYVLLEMYAGISDAFESAIIYKIPLDGL